MLRRRNGVHDAKPSAHGGLQRRYEHMFYTTGMCISSESGTTPLDAFLQALAGFVEVPRLELTAFELGEHLVRLRHGIDRLELHFAMGAAAFAATDEFEVQGSVTPIDWIRHHCQMSGHAAARAVAAGEQLHRLPVSVAAVEAGEIGFAHFSLLAGVARGCSARPLGGDLGVATDAGDSGDPAATDVASRDAASDPTDSAEPIAPATSGGRSAFDERPLLELAREHSVGLFSKDCERARHAYDAAAVLDEHVAAAERNRCDFIPCEGGFLAIRGFFDPIAAATIKTAVLPLAKPTGAGDHRSWTRRIADALVEVASHALDVGAVPTSGGASTHLQLTASVETVMGLDGTSGGELEFAGVVPAATVQRLACDARIRRVLLGPNSAVIDVGRALRLPSAAARAALRVRSGGCDWPRCDRPVAFTNAHHLVHWGHGGATDVDNLVRH